MAHDAQGFGESKTDKEKLHAYIADMQHLAADLIQIRKVSRAVAYGNIGLRRKRIKCARCLQPDDFLIKDAKDSLVQELIDPRQSQQAVPVFVGGQSMGGLVAALVAIRDQTIWQVLFCMHVSACMGL